MNDSPKVETTGGGESYDKLLSSLSQVIADARRASVRAVNAYLTSVYWLIGRYIVEYEQGGAARAHYGDALLTHLALDLTPQWGRGFSQRNLALMRSFYQLGVSADSVCTIDA